MARVGGGGAGNVAGGSNPAGTGTSLNYVGDHVYAYNNYNAQTTSISFLNFTTGSEYIVGEMALGPLVNLTDTTDGKRSTASIKLNGSIVGTMSIDAAAADQQTPAVMPIVIPPYTHVEFVIKGQVDSSTYTGTAGLTGRLY